MERSFALLSLHKRYTKTCSQVSQPLANLRGLDALKVVTHLGGMSSQPVYRCFSLAATFLRGQVSFLPCAHWSGRQDQVSGQDRHPQLAAHTSGVRVSASIMTGSVS